MIGQVEGEDNLGPGYLGFIYWSIKANLYRGTKIFDMFGVYVLTVWKHIRPETAWICHRIVYEKGLLT